MLFLIRLLVTLALTSSLPEWNGVRIKVLSLLRCATLDSVFVQQELGWGRATFVDTAVYGLP